MNLFIFRRDLRIDDNNALFDMIKKFPNQDNAFIFIYNTFQIKNEYHSSKAFDFMNQALKLLSKKINLNLFKSKEDVEVINEIHKYKKIENIFVNQDITKFAIDRENKIENWCFENHVNFYRKSDYTLFSPGEIRNNNNQSFKVFKNFYDKAKEKLLDISVTKINSEISSIILDSNKYSCKLFKGNNWSFPISKNDIFYSLEQLKNYSISRNQLDNPFSTSKISAALKFGIISCREIVKIALSLEMKNDSFLRQLLWKEFFYQYYIENRSNYILRSPKSTNISKKWDKWKYENNLLWIELWKNGETGIKLIDAAMNQLNKTGYMHNRMRMLVATFLCKNMNIDWRIGEKYFAQKLIDYDPIINNQSWQWCAGTGLDFRGSFRTFSPVIQQKKYDPNNKYIDYYLENNIEESIIDIKKSRKIFLNNYKNFLIK
ncbi:MAG: deoxyribodipyrimidine photo-lyase [Mycoplasmatales bacterium]|nr:deoxyribodipyrimidine photo-lyase [Mycoplasmatales bacterium]